MVATAGAVAKASDVNALTGLTTRLDADTTAVNNSTVLVNTGLVIALAANTVYRLDSLIVYDTSATADLKWGLSCPAGLTGTASLWGSGLAAAATDSTIFHDAFTWTGSITTGTIGGVASGTLMSARIVGTVRTAATAGNMTFQFAQNTATVVNTLIKKDSWMIAQAI